MQWANIVGSSPGGKDPIRYEHPPSVRLRSCRPLSRAQRADKVRTSRRKLRPQVDLEIPELLDRTTPARLQPLVPSMIDWKRGKKTAASPQFPGEYFFTCTAVFRR